MATNQKPRDYLFDNYKGLLILLVVIGHFIEPNYTNNNFLYTLKWLIVSFHMPAFIFISGYFSKRELSIGMLLQKLAVPYIVYEVIYYLFYTFILHKDTGLYLLYPKFSLWYILALFVWRLITPYVKKIPHHMLLAVAAGLLIGISGMKDNFLSIPRILVFYPFFLAGIHFERDQITYLKRPFSRIAAVFCILGFTGFFACNALYRDLSPKVFYGRYNYHFLGQDISEGMLCRLICYGAGFIMTFAVMALITERKTIFSYIGTRTMAVYLFHGLTYSYLKECTDILANVNTIAESLVLILSCAALTVLFSAKSLTTFTNTVAHLHLPKDRSGLPAVASLFHHIPYPEIGCLDLGLTNMSVRRA